MIGQILKQRIPALILIGVYVLLANARTVSANPLAPGDPVDVPMILPVLAGVLFGPLNGLLVGFFGTMLNAATPAGDLFDVLSILPHALMGWLAGWLAGRVPTPIPMLSIYAGLLLNTVAYLLAGELRWREATHSQYLLARAGEGLMILMACLILAALYRVGRQGMERV